MQFSYENITRDMSWKAGATTLTCTWSSMRLTRRRAFVFLWFEGQIMKVFCPDETILALLSAIITVFRLVVTTRKWFCLVDRKRAMTFAKKYGYVSTRRVKKEINRLSLFSSGTPVTPSHWENWIRTSWVFLALSRKRSLQRDDATCEKAGTPFLDYVSLLLSCYQSHNRRFRYRNGRSPMACLRANCSRVN